MCYNVKKKHMGELKMSDELTFTQTEILLAFNDTPDRKSMNYLLAEHDGKFIYDACMDLKNRGYFIDNIEFLFSMKGNFRADVVVHEYGSLPASMCNVLSEKGMNAIREYI